MAGNRKRNVEIDVVVDDKKARAQLKGIGDSASQTGQGFSRLGGAMKLAGVAIAAGAVVTVQALERIERISAQTDAAIKSTGGAAGVTREHIEGLAGSLEGLTSVEAETIQEGQNLLLTFTKISNGVGEGNDIFDQATKTVLDMSVAMGSDMSAASILVGKALNDPIKGLTALTRVGVAFTAEQRQQITAMVEAGDVMGAQKLILAELNTEFGGSAEALGGTLTGRIDKVKNSFGEMTEGLLIGTLPTIERLVTGLGIMSIAFAEITGTLTLSEMAIKQYELEMGKTADTAQDLITIWKVYNVSAFDLLDTMKLSTEELVKLRDADEDYLRSIGWTTEGIKKMDDAVADLIVNEQKAERDVDRHEAATRRLTDATEDYTDATKELTSPLFALFSSTDRLEEAQRKLGDVIAEHGEKGDAWEQAVLDLAKAQEDMNLAASRYAEEGGTASVNALRTLLEQAGLSEAAIRRIIGAIDEMNARPVKWVTGKGGSIVGREIVPGRPAFHSGGVVPGSPGEDVPILAQAGETVIPAGGGMGGGGSETIIIQIDGETVARAVRKHNARHDRRNGL